MEEQFEKNGQQAQLGIRSYNMYGYSRTFWLCLADHLVCVEMPEKSSDMSGFTRLACDHPHIRKKRNGRLLDTNLTKWDNGTDHVAQDIGRKCPCVEDNRPVMCLKS